MIYQTLLIVENQKFLKLVHMKHGVLGARFLHPKCAKTDLRASVISKKISGVIPRTPLNRGRGGEGRGGEEVGMDVVSPLFETWIRPWNHSHSC
jgi:hypothetical protein